MESLEFGGEFFGTKHSLNTEPPYQYSMHAYGFQEIDKLVLTLIQLPVSDDLYAMGVCSVWK